MGYETHQDLAVKPILNLDKQKVLDNLTFKSNDTVLFTEIFGPQVGVKSAWRQQGATEDEINLSTFKYQTAKQVGLPVSTARTNHKLTQVSEDDTTVNFIDDLGMPYSLTKNIATLPLPTKYPVKNMDDWLKIKHLYEFINDRVPNKIIDFYQNNLHNILMLWIPGGFDQPRQLMGEEEVSCAIYEQPELIHDMLNTMQKTALQVIDKVANLNVKADFLMIHEDMAGKSGSLWGPNHILEFIKPYTLPIWEKAQERLGCQIFGQDSDGDMNSVIDAVLECGINLMYPLEPGANMDIVQLREKYGTKLAMTGGLDKYVLLKEKADIDKELETKLPHLINSGGIIFGLDHRIVKGTTIENYRYYINKFWEIANSCKK